MAWPPEDGTPYMPANGTEGADFEASWCNHCIRDAGFRQTWADELGEFDVPGCDVLANGTLGHQPSEWTFRNGCGHCSAFTEDPSNPPRCHKTLEMFQ